MDSTSHPYTFSQSHAFVEKFIIEAKATGSLTGLAFAVKDLIDVAGYKTGCGNPTWKQQHSSAIVNALCIDQLLYSGAKCLGKTVTSQFAFDLIGENIFFETPLNPKAPAHVPGGSSSGSASAVACGLVDFAIGTDTGGSVRVPASNCGVFGMRPSHDAISVAGVMPFAPTFDTIGIFASSLSILQKVATCLLSFRQIINSPIKNIYILEDAFKLIDERSQMAFAPLIQKLNSFFPLNSISIHDIEQSSSPQGLETWRHTFTTIQQAEIWSSLGYWIEVMKPELGETVTTSFQLAKNVDRSKLTEAISMRKFYFEKLISFLKPNDLICIPTTPIFAPLKGSIGRDRSKDHYYKKLSSLTCIAGIGRLPQVTIPCAEVEGKPIGLSFLGAYQNDSFLLQLLKNICSIIM